MVAQESATTGAERAYRAVISRLRRAQPRSKGAATRLARALTALGAFFQRQGRYREAEPVFLEAIGHFERGLGPHHLEVVTAINNLAVCYKYLARYTDAGRLYQRALAMTERALGPDAPEVATIYHNLGGLEHAAGNWMRGEPFARKAVRIRRRALGPHHPDLAADLAALAALLDQQQQYAEAERLYRRALAILERSPGVDDSSVAANLNNLGALCQAQGRREEAERMYRRAIAINSACLGADHPKVGFGLNNLAVLLRDDGRTREAAACCRRALALFRRALGRSHPNVAIVLENYGSILHLLGRKVEAKTCARRAAAILARVDAVNDDAVGLTGTINPDHARFRLVVRPSPIHRLGVFADERIPPWRKVIEYTGERISRYQTRRRWDPKRSYLFTLDKYWTIDGAIGGSGAEYINHSCAPNLRTRILRGHILYFSNRVIEVGEELTVDYRYSDEVTRMPCRCGAPTCRGTMNVRGRDTRGSRVSRRRGA